MNRWTCLSPSRRELYDKSRTELYDKSRTRTRCISSMEVLLRIKVSRFGKDGTLGPARLRSKNDILPISHSDHLCFLPFCKISRLNHLCLFSLSFYYCLQFLSLTIKPYHGSHRESWHVSQIHHSPTDMPPLGLPWHCIHCCALFEYQKIRSRVLWIHFTEFHNQMGTKNSTESRIWGCHCVGYCNWIREWWKLGPYLKRLMDKSSTLVLLDPISVESSCQSLLEQWWWWPSVGLCSHWRFVWQVQYIWMRIEGIIPHLHPISCDAKHSTLKWLWHSMARQTSSDLVENISLDMFSSLGRGTPTSVRDAPYIIQKQHKLFLFKTLNIFWAFSSLLLYFHM